MNDAPLLRALVPDLAETLWSGASLRAAGGTFDAVFRFPDDRAVIASRAARDVIAATADPALRLARLDALGAHDARIGSKRIDALTPLSRAEHESARDFLALARYVRVGSWMELTGLVMQLGMLFRSHLATPTNRDVPAAPADRPRGERIVVWAPERTTDDLALVIAGACADGAPVDVVCAGGERAGYDVRLVDLDDAADALRSADVIVDATLDDAGAALALAAWGRALCASSTSGANFWLRGLTTYRPWSRPDVTAAIAFARALPAPRADVMPAMPEPPSVPLPRGGPRVRIVIRCDGATPCAITQRSLERLSYADRELVVAQSDDAARAEARAGDATYVMLLDDGDQLYADAVSRLVAALEESGEDRARGDAVVTYLVEAPGVPHTLGQAVIGPHAPYEDTVDGLPLRTLWRRERLRTGNAELAGIARVNAPLGSAHRYLDGRSAFLLSAPSRPTRTPALPLHPPQPLIGG